MPAGQTRARRDTGDAPWQAPGTRLAGAPAVLLMERAHAHARTPARCATSRPWHAHRGQATRCYP